MAVPRSRTYSGPGHHSFERLLAWNCRHPRAIPDEFLEHADPEVRELARLTQATTVASLTTIWRAISAAEAGRPIDYGAEEGDRVALWRQYDLLASARQAFAERRGLTWRHPYPHAAVADSSDAAD